MSTGAGVRASAAHGDEVLILFDDSGPYAELGELYATGAAVLVSHFARWRMLPASRYRAGDLLSRRAAVYIGTTYDAPLPAAFLDDVLSAQKPVLWIDENIWQLARRRDDFAQLYGFTPTVFSADHVQHVIYKGVHLDRQTRGGSDVMHFGALDPSKARVLAWAESTDGRQLPWGIKARNLFYIGENPFVFIGATDRYLAFCDLLFELLAPETPERHRALLRIEDVHPETSPEMLRAIADYLVSQKVPYSVAVVPVYVDPKGAESAGHPEHVSMRQAPEFVAALRYMHERGATFVLHGYTHQYGSVANPYNGVTGDDFEFYRAHIDEHDNVIQTGPVAEDSAAWALDRVERAFAEFDAVGLPRPSIFEYPHYAGSVVDSRALAQRFDTAYHRGTYFGRGQGGEVSYARGLSLFFPYVVRDIYGWKVIPENVGNYIPVGYNNNSQRSVRDMVRIAEVNRVVRDGFASMFYHPVFKLSVLRDIVEGVRAAGYEFVSVDQL